MSNGTISRRDFLSRSGGVFGAAWLAANFPAIAAAANAAHRVASGEVEESFEFFPAADAALIDAICAHIIPSEGAGPGAREAKVVVFIDRAMTGFAKSGADDFVAGLKGFAQAFSDAWPQEASFASAEKSVQHKRNAVRNPIHPSIQGRLAEKWVAARSSASWHARKCHSVLTLLAR